MLINNDEHCFIQISLQNVELKTHTYGEKKYIYE